MLQEELRKAVRGLAIERQCLQRFDADLHKHESDYQATEEYQDYLGVKHDKGVQQDMVSVAEDRVRDLTLAAYAETGDKKPAGGVSIRVYTQYDYDADEALTWCKVNAPTFVVERLDEKAFKKVADTLAQQGAPVSIREDPKPTIAKDLSEYLQGA